MRNRILVSLFGLAALTAGAAFWQWSAVRSTPTLPPLGLEMGILPQPKPLAGFRLGDQQQRGFTQENLKGQWSFVFFGYTHCPDICPTTLMTLSGVSKRLAGEPLLAKDTRFVFVSVDPKRDSPEHLKGYLEYFDPGFLGITGEREQIDKLAAQVGAIYMFEGDTSKEDYIVNHSATLYLVDPEGRFYARITPPHSVEGVLDSYRRIRNFHG